MVNFSIQTIISPLVKPTNHCFDRGTSYVFSRNRESSTAAINHDLKALIFNAASIIIISAAAMAYLKIIYLTTAAVLAIPFLLLRRVIDETMKPTIPEKAEERTRSLEDMCSFTRNQAQILQVSPPAPERSWASYFYDENALSIANIHIWKFTKYPFIKVLSMITKRKT